MYLFMFLSLHTHTNNNKTHTDKGSRVRLCYDKRKWWKEGDRKKKETDEMNVHHAQYRKMKGMEK